MKCLNSVLEIVIIYMGWDFELQIQVYIVDDL